MDSVKPCVSLTGPTPIAGQTSALGRARRAGGGRVEARTCTSSRASIASVLFVVTCPPYALATEDRTDRCQHSSSPPWRPSLGRTFWTRVTRPLRSTASTVCPGGDRLPAGVAFPRSVEDVQALVRLAKEHGATLWPASTGHNLGLGEFSPVRETQVVVDLGRRMNRVLEVNETLGYAVIEPGVTFQALRAELAAAGDKLMISSTSGPPDGSVLGNALDRGAGYTPYFDHFGMTCGLEVVLPDATVLRTGDGALTGSRMASLNKSGFGPLLDGLFSQSNFGIVTSATIWLMPRPPVIRGWAFTFDEDADLEQAIELVRPLKLNTLCRR